MWFWNLKLLYKREMGDQKKKNWFSLAKQLSLENHMLSFANYAFSFAILRITIAIVAFYQLTLTITIIFMPIKLWVSA